jgi:uncharacterized protein (DUF433 family)
VSTLSTAPPRQYVRTDEYDVMRVGDTRVTLDGVVYSWEDGASPETICQEYPSLSLEQVYGAIAWYLANRDAVSAYLKQQQRRFDELKAAADANPSPVMQRLRAAKRDREAKQQ